MIYIICYIIAMSLIFVAWHVHIKRTNIMFDCEVTGNRGGLILSRPVEAE
jgi:hypothetical protein